MGKSLTEVLDCLKKLFVRNKKLCFFKLCLINRQNFAKGGSWRLDFHSSHKQNMLGRQGVQGNPRLLAEKEEKSYFKFFYLY